ncbi:hypothetical protein ACEPPN_019383 [Leptodophora sp. 'Broadleaf-Isolate-01']
MSVDSLHVQYEYQVLNPPGSTTRLLTLLPGEFEDDVFMEILHVELGSANNVKYEALSYAWGSPNQHHEKIYIYETKLEGGTSVKFLEFLSIRVNLYLALRHLRLPNAPRVVWIDAICIDQQNITEKGQQVGRMGEIYHRAERVVVWLGPDDRDTPMALETIKTLSAGITVGWHHRNITTIPGSQAEIFRTRPEESSLKAAHWAALNKFITRPWFQRLWVRQEVQLASKVLVRCGYFEIEWKDIEKTVLFLEHTPGARAYFAINDILFCRSMFLYHGSDSLTYILHRSSKCGHFDDRDLVYANLATSTAIKSLQIRPNYTLSVAAVYKDLICQYLQKFGTLDILRACDLQSRPQDFNSFVPVFFAPKSESRLFSIFAHAGSRHLPIDPSGETLPLKGKSVAKVSQVSKFLRPLLASDDFDDSTRNIIKTFQRWEPKDLTTASYPTGGSLLDAYVSLLAGGFCKEIYGYQHLPTKGESMESFLAVVWSGGDLDRISDHKFRAYLGELTSDRRGEVFFQTAEGYIGTAPVGVGAEIGDIISVLVGGSVPFILRPVPEEPDRYQLVGPCFLQGVMFGEGILGLLPEPWSYVLDHNGRWRFKNGTSGKLTWEDPRLWPLSSPWQVHFCDYNDKSEPCRGGCVDKQGEEGNSMKHYWFNVETKHKSRDDPRLDLAGLEQGGIVLETFPLV